MTKIAILALAGASLVWGAQQAKTYTGVITDSMCGLNHKAMNVSPDSKCVRECVKHGSKYALLDGGNMYILSDQQTPEKYAGQKVKITGTLYEKTKILKVDSIEPASGHDGMQMDMDMQPSGHSGNSKH